MRISSVQVVSTYNTDESIVLTCGQALKQVQKKIGGNILTINTPEDAPPPLPRVILKLEDTLLNISLDRFHITMRPPTHIYENFSEVTAYTLSRAKSILSDLLLVSPPYEWSGVIIELESPISDKSVGSGAKAVTPVFDRLLKLTRGERELAAFQLLFGYVENGFFVNYTISGYEKRNITISKPPGGIVRLDAADFPITEVGIGILIDVNNKLKIRTTTPMVDLESIVDILTKKYDSIVGELNMEGLIQ